MILQLYLNGSLFNEMHLPAEDFLDSDLGWKANVSFRKSLVEGYVMEMKGLFWRQISKSKNYEIVLVCPSKINLMQEEEIENLL